MTLHDLQRLALGPALSLLPPDMDTPPARAFLMTIALQESALKDRRQVGGPARGWWQFEHAGVFGVLRHERTAELAAGIAARLGYRAEATEVQPALEHNDVLAAVIGRLLLWTLPYPLPGEGNPRRGWSQYLEAWRPGKPHARTWGAYWADAWAAVA